MARTQVRSPWSSASDAFSFGLACQQVIALRLARIARGGPMAQREATRMVSEKMFAVGEAQLAAAFGMVRGGPATAAAEAGAVYSRAVRANTRRLRK